MATEKPDGVWPPSDITGFAIGFEATLILVAIVLGWMLQISPLERVGGINQPTEDLQAIGIGAVAILPMILMLVVIRTVPWQAFRQLNQLVDQQVAPLFSGASLAGLLVISMTAGVGEELLFRGVLYGKFEIWWGAPAAAVVSSILFGVCHWLTATYAVLATIIGGYLAFLLHYFDNLLVPIVAHALYDFVALAFLVHRQPAETEA